MLKFYYTGGSSNYLASKSLGGVMSPTVIPNSSLGNLFESFSVNNIKNLKLKPILGFILKNEDNEKTLSNLKLWFEYDENIQKRFSKYKIGFVSPSINGNVVSMEIIQPYSTPYYVSDFYESDGEDNALSLPNIEPSGVLGIWLQKEFIKSNIDDYYSNQNIYDRFTNKTEDYLEELVNMKLTWDESV
jgi:hypothetical protein